MKTLALVVLMSCSIMAQNFFPLYLNNKYQFIQSVASSGQHGGSWSNLKSYGVLSDTIINDKRLFKFTPGQFNTNYLFYYDQPEQKIYVKLPGNDTLKVAVDFNIPDGEFFTSFITGSAVSFLSKGISSSLIFGDTVSTFRMTTNQWYMYPSYSYTFAENVGLYYSTDTSIVGSNRIALNNTLLSAIIDTICYNPVLLEIISLSPLINRPAAAFPFTMQSSYYTNLTLGSKDLVDSFYVEIIQIRDTDTIGTFNYPFSSANSAYITLMPEEGDKLLVKAVITDTSIYYNYETFPDTGYAEILVLENPTDADEYNKLLSFSLEQNYPNPFNPSTIIKYSVASASFVTLTVYDVMGNEIAALVNEEKQPGIYTTEFNGAGLSSGVYYYKLTAGDKKEIRKMMLLK